MSTVALSVAKPKAQPKLVVTVNNGGMQGSNANPQQTANPQKTYNPAPATYNPQQTANPQQAAQAAAAQSAATNRQIALAVEAARVQTAAAVARVKEASRSRVQGEVDTKVSANKAAFGLKVTSPTWRGKLSVAKSFKAPKIVLPQQDEYDKAYAAAYNKAMGDVQTKTKTGKQNLAQKIVDKVSGGSDRRQLAARAYADRQAQFAVNASVKAYGLRLGGVPLRGGFLNDQAKRLAGVEASKLQGEAAYNQAVADYTKWEKDQIAGLERDRAGVVGQADAYGKASQAPLTSKGAAAASLFKRNVINGLPGAAGGWLMKHTLGQGDKNIPSLVTALNRAVNTIGNFNTKDRTIYRSDQTTFNRDGSDLNAWQASHKQRTVNQKPWTDKKYDPKEAEKRFGAAAAKQAANFQKWGKVKDPSIQSKDYWLRRYWDDYNFQHRFKNTALDLVADPINFVSGAGVVAKSSKLTSSLSSAAKASKLGGWVAGAAAKVKANAAVTWLGAEQKNVAARRHDYVNEELDDIYLKKPAVRKLLANWQLNKNSIKAAEKAKIFQAITKDFAQPFNKKTQSFIGDPKKDIKVFQRAFIKGDWGVKGSEKLDPVVRAQFEGLITKYRGKFDDMQRRENKKGVATPYRSNYLPQYAGKFSVSVRKAKKTAGEYWFTKKRKANEIQGRERFIDSLSARTYGSAVARQDLPVLRDMVAGYKDIGRNIERIDAAGSTIKSTPWEKAMSVVGAPTRAWKKSVLLGNPAWYANNEVFNQIQGISHGGLGFIKNQLGTAKYLDHIEKNAVARYKPSVARGMVADVGSTVANEVGNSKFARLATKQENRSRVSLYRTFRQRGFTHQESVKKLDKALFNYTTKNWERPIKAVIPFWHFQKNVAKAAARMPFEKPLTARAFNKVDQYQQQQYERDFDTTVPELKKLGYTDAEIADFRAGNAKYFAGRLKVGNKYITTPFNAFNEKQMGQLGFNPYLAGAGEIADSTDAFGNKIIGKQSSFMSRLASKFPQANLANQAAGATLQAYGVKSPDKSWIGLPGSGGYGMTKEKQGYDKSKPNYVASMDARAKLGQNALAFMGVPRSLEFDKPKFIKAKTLQKASQAYFGNKWKTDVPVVLNNAERYKAEQANLKKMFKTYGMVPDDFYKGVLAKYDTAQTTSIKKLKADASVANGSLYDEYGKQPKGTRNLWATKKLRELVESNYFATNPFLKSFDWVKPESFAKADKQTLVQQAIASGDWSAYRAKYGLTQKQKDHEYATKSGDWSIWRKKYGLTQKQQDHAAATSSGNWTAWRNKYGQTDKSLARDVAVSSGNWTAYAQKYGVTKKTTPFKLGDKFFKSAETMAKYKEGQFWQGYANASKAERQKLIAANPEYNKRSNWTAAMWLTEKKRLKTELKAKTSTIQGFSRLQSDNKAAFKVKSLRFQGTLNRRAKRVSYKVA